MESGCTAAAHASLRAGFFADSLGVNSLARSGIITPGPAQLAAAYGIA